MPKPKLETISADPEVQKFYEQMRKRGESHALAEMLALRKVPACRTDDLAFKGQKNGQQFAGKEALGNALAKKLRKAGGSPAGKQYIGGLARFPGDPEAWVSSRGDIRRVVEKRGWSCEGLVNVSANRDNFDPGPGVGIADDIVEDRLRKAAAQDPSLVATKKKRAKAKAEIREKIKPHWVKD
jgi:hypothetical protein